MKIKNILLNSRITHKIVINYISNRVANKQYQKYKNECERLKNINNIHKGKRCFIIGTGPSLRIEDLERLKNEYTIASNRIYELFDKTDWRPTYYINQDHDQIKKLKKEIQNINVERKFFPIDYINELTGKNIYYFVLKYHEYYPNKAEFSFNLEKYLGQGFTVTYGAIQLAVYMGFEKIYLLGIDHNYNVKRDAKGKVIREENIINYANGMQQNSGGYPRIEESTIAYETAELISKKTNSFKIYNATRGGKLEAFQRVEFDKLF